LGASLYNLLLFANRVDEAQPRLARLQKIIDWKKDGKLKGYNGLGGASIIFKKSLEPRVLLDK